jgi:hypothetical protein
MKQDSKQEDSLKKTIKILAEITRKDTQRLDNFSDIKLSLPKMVLVSYPLLKEL